MLNFDFKRIFRIIFRNILPNLHHLLDSEFRRCNCCRKLTLILCLSKGDEFRLCIRCRANFRYEMIASYLRLSFSDLKGLDVVELSPNSPLRTLLRTAKTYIRTYYSNTEAKGSARADGARCEDITDLTFEDESFDIIVSCDVLEHVNDLQSAFRETYRILRPGGIHLFTVPTGETTIKRADIEESGIIYLTAPQYHLDPSNPDDILAFWTFGTDAGRLFSFPGLQISILDGPKGRDDRVIWGAVKTKKMD